MSRVVALCPWRLPAAVEDLPYDAAGRPFPTLYYVTCPTAVAAIAALESAGGVRRYGELARREPALRKSLSRAVRDERARRSLLAARYRLDPTDGGAALRAGIGGVGDPRRITCLHAHAAHALARPSYALGARILAEAEPLWCADRRCAVFCEPAS